MTTPNAPAQDTYAPVWDRLRAWRDLALKAAANAPAQLSRRQAEPMQRWIFVLEFVLRRLVLIAAIALVANMPQKAARASTRTSSGRPATTAHPNPNSFRLYANERRPPGHVSRTTTRRTAIPAGEAAPSARRKPRPATPFDSLLSGSQHEQPERPEQSEQPAPDPRAAEHCVENRAPATYDAKAFEEYIAYLAQLIANPDKLIARAARALMHKREIAVRLAYQRPPRARGVLRTMPRLIADILTPLHDALSDILFNYGHANTS